MRKLLSDLFDIHMDATCIHCDNQTCVKLLENLVFHDKSKHIEIKYHYIRDMGESSEAPVCCNGGTITDVLMKPLARVKFDYFKEKLGVLKIEVSSKGK